MARHRLTIAELEQEIGYENTGPLFEIIKGVNSGEIRMMDAYEQVMQLMVEVKYRPQE